MLGFSCTGLWPVDADIFTDRDFAPSSLTDEPLPISAEIISQPYEPPCELIGNQNCQPDEPLCELNLGWWCCFPNNKKKGKGKVAKQTVPAVTPCSSCFSALRTSMVILVGKLGYNAKIANFGTTIAAKA
nr:hypothetical protein BgiMline_007670 [Biomphalaria glabrata]